MILVRVVSVCSLVACASVASAADRYVSRFGNDASNTCLVAASPCRSIDWATTQAGSGDVIKVASGKYKDRIHLLGDATLTLSGGWSPDFTQRSPRLTPTLLKPMRSFADGTSSQVRVGDGDCCGTTSTITATIDGFVIQRGRGTDYRANEAVTIDADNDDAFTLAFVDVDFVRNLKGSFAIRAVGNATVDVTMTRCRLLKNKENDGRTAGIGIFSGNTAAVDVTVTDTLIARNHGAGVEIAASEFFGGPSQVNVRLANVTITANSRRGVIVEAFDTGANVAVALVNAIVWGNTFEIPFGPTDGTDLRAAADGAGSTITIARDHSDLHDVVAGTGAVLNDLGGNVDVDPSFVRADQSYHLNATSPLVDAGTNTGITATDLDGDARPSDGDGDTIATSDIGADEVP